MKRFTLTDDGRLLVHAPLGEQDISPEDAEAIRDALESPRLPFWLDAAAFVAMLLAFLVMMRGGGA